MDVSLSKYTKMRLGLDHDPPTATRGCNTSSPDLIQLSDSDGIGAKSGNGYEIMISDDVEDFPHDGQASGCMSNGTSRSPSVSSPASESPTPTNSANEKTWTAQHEPQWQTLVNDEHRQLLGTEDDSSDRHSSDEETTEEDLWAMTGEQEEYYLQQFISIQPDSTALLPGNKAKEFFEKSKLPVGELSKIWQLADVTEDGALSLEEFYAAMHLVVLRRNNIDIPNSLPRSLYPKSFINQAVSDVQRPSISKISNLNKSYSLESNSMSDDHKSLPSIRSVDKPESCEEHVISPSKSKEWAKFSESPTNILSSPGPKPCNFDFLKSAVEKDPKILHPKPLRLTPESNLSERMDDNSGNSSQNKDPRYNHHLNSSFSNCSSLKCCPDIADSSMSYIACGGAKSISPVPNHDSKDIMSRSLHGPSSLSVTIGHPQTKMELPPPPPPRSYRNHVRSSSLDLNKAQKLTVGPPVPPRASPNMGSPQRVLSGQHDDEGTSNRLSDVSEDSTINLPSTSEERSRHSAFEVYKKPHSDEPSPNAGKTTQPEDINQSNQYASSSRALDKRDVLSSLRTLKEKNIVLSRVNSELNQELAEVIEERIALQYQLEQMKPFSH